MIKKWHLFAFVTVLFISSFYVINLRFDKFYRVHGINNDNRGLIELYLSEDDQEYLIENQIDINDFITYIKIEGFSLKNYQYYGLLKNTNVFKSNEQIVQIGNTLQTRLEFLYPSGALSKAKELIEKDILDAFLNEDQFDFKYLNLYTSLAKMYNDTTYVNDLAGYLDELSKRGITKTSQLEEIFSLMAMNYSEDSLRLLMKNNNLKDRLIFNPMSFTTVLNKNTYIASYEPANLILIQGIPKVKYSMYLQSEAYEALLEMYEAVSKEYDSLLLYNAYVGYDFNEDDKKGYDERQLGTSINVSKRYVSYNQFDETDLSKWLEEHSYEYGFILRYPKNKASSTNHAYDAHTYRYVGKTIAKALYESNKTLEEYESEK